MAPEQITLALQAIGPHVRYDLKDADGTAVHTWLVTEKPNGPPSPRNKAAMLIMAGDIVPLSEDDIAEGRLRYEASANG